MKTEYRSVDQLEQELLDLESLRARITARELELIRELDVAQVTTLDGSKTLGEWLAGRLDMDPRTATRLAGMARAIDPRLEAELAEGRVTPDRAAAETDLELSGADDRVVAHSRSLDINGVRQLRARTERMTPKNEIEASATRRIAMQPNLDESVFQIWGRLPGFDGQVVSKALEQSADHLYETYPTKAPTSQRMADALVSVAQDSLDRVEPTTPSQDPLVSVFVDATMTAAGATTADGPDTADTTAAPNPPAWMPSGIRIGPETLERILCTGAVEVITVDHDLNPIAATPAHRAIPPKLRRAVLARDGGCVVDGCTSTYRLQPHHVVPAGQGGTTTSQNLATVCWFQHHVVIHGHGRQLDPASPPRRRRFLRPPTRPDPPRV